MTIRSTRASRLSPNDVGEQSVERERRSTSDLKQRFLAAATLTETFALIVYWGVLPMLAFRQIFCRPKHLRMHLTLFAIGSLLVAAPAWGQPRGVKKGEVVKRAPAITPNISMATAVDQDGNVVIRVSASEIRIKNTTPDDKDAKGWITCWTEQDPLILGRQMRAYKPSGEKLDDQAVLKALTKPVAVACFQRHHKDDPELPDPFYTGVFREDLVILVYDAKYWLRDED